jgi:hypothetical protein
LTEAGRRLAAPNPRPTDYLDVWAVIAEAEPTARRNVGALDPSTPTIRRVYPMARLDAEVKNGGFSQFLFNGGGVWLDDAISGLGAAGLAGHRQVVEAAARTGMARLDALQAAQRENTLEAYAAYAAASELGPHDDQLYDLEEVGPAVDRFIAAHAADIWEPGR